MMQEHPINHEVFQPRVDLSIIYLYQVKTLKDVVTQIDNRPDLIDFVTDIVESGIIQPSFDKNDPLLKLRKIYITNYINNYIDSEDILLFAGRRIYRKYLQETVWFCVRVGFKKRYGNLVVPVKIS